MPRVISVVGLAIFLLPFTIYTQSYDVTPTRKKAKGLNQIGIGFYNKSAYDSAAKYFMLAAGMAELVNDLTTAANAYSNGATVNYQLGNSRDAIFAYERAIEIFKKTGEPKQQAKTEINLGIAYKDLNLYAKALDNLYKGSLVLDSIGLKKPLATAYNSIGNIHRELGTMDLAYEYLNEALSLKNELNLYSSAASTLHNIGLWYFANEDFNQSKITLLEALKQKKQHSSESSWASTLAKLGEIYLKQDSIAMARDYMEQSLQIREKYKDAAGISTAANHLARLYLRQKDLATSEAFIEKALEISRRDSLLQEQVISNRLLQEIRIQQGDYKAAVALSNRLTELSSQILNEESSKYMIDAEIKFDLGLKDQEIAEKQIEVIELQNTNRLLLIAALVFVLLAIATGILLNASRKLARERNSAKERVERLLSELNHRTKNHLQTQSALIKQQLMKLKDESAREHIKDIDNQITAINLIHTSLYQSTEESPETINLTSYIVDIVENLIISFGYRKPQIDPEYDLEQVDIDIHKALPLGLIINETVTNSFKHAFQSQKDKKVFISLKKQQNNSICLDVCDNGSGFDLDKVDPKSSGLNIIRGLVEDLSGQLKIETQGKTEISIIFRT